MKKILIIFLSALWTFSLGISSKTIAAEPKPQGTVSSNIYEIPRAPVKAQESAERGKGRFERLTINNKFAQELGFDSRSQATSSKTTLGAPFPVIIVNFLMLKTFTPKVPPATLLIFTKRFLYPVAASGEVKSSITVYEPPAPVNGKQEWKPIEWGAPGLVRLLDRARVAAGSKDTSFALWIPQLSRYFLGDIRKEKFFIIPLSDIINIFSFHFSC